MVPLVILPRENKEVEDEMVQKTFKYDFGSRLDISIACLVYGTVLAVATTDIRPELRFPFRDCLSGAHTACSGAAQ